MLSDSLHSKKIGILDYSTGNTSSVGYFLDRLGFSHALISTPGDLIDCDAAILPGVGHFHTACQSLRESGLFNELKCLSDAGFPLIGICLGFQLMTMGSEESPNDPGLEIFPFNTFEIKPSLPNFRFLILAGILWRALY